MCNPNVRLSIAYSLEHMQAVDLPCSDETQVWAGLMYQREGDCPAGNTA